MKAGDKKPRSDSRRKTVRIVFRVTPEQLAVLTKAPANDNYPDGSLARWMRDVLMEEVGLPGRVHRVLPDLIREMRKIGVNINQIARVANRAGQVEHETRLSRCMEEMTDLMLRAARALQ